MSDHAAHDGQVAVSVKSDVSSVLLNLKKSAAAMLQDKERSRHSESVWRERLSERELRVTELEHIVHTEQQKSAAMASTMQEHKAQESYLSRRVRALTMLASELQTRVNKLQGTVKAGEELRTQNVEKCFAEEHMRNSLMNTVSDMERRIEDLHAAICTAQADVKDKEGFVAIQQAEIASLQTGLADVSLKLSVKEDERSILYQELLAEKDSAKRLREKLSSVEGNLTTVSNEKVSLQTCIEHARCDLSELEDKHGILLESMKETEEQKFAVSEEKVILEQQVAAITAEQLHHVMQLEDKVSSLEIINQQQNLDNADESSKVSKEHAVEIETMRQEIMNLRSQLDQQCHTLESVKATNSGLRQQLQKIQETTAQHEQARHAQEKKIDELTTELGLARSCITELEVQRAVAKATCHVVMDSMEQASRALSSSLERLTRELQDAKQAEAHTAHQQETLRQKHDQQLLEMRELMEAAKVHQAKAMLDQRRQMEVEMRSSLCMLEEQAAMHVRSVQQNFTTAQKLATAKETECNTLNERVIELAAQIEVLNNAKKATQAHWEIQETQLCVALQEERKAHQYTVKQVNEKHEAACAKHAQSLQDAREELQAMANARQNELQEHAAKITESEMLYATLQRDLDACQLKISDLTKDASLKDSQLKSLEAEVQKKAGLLKSISDKIATPDVDPMAMPPAEPWNNKETAAMTGPSRKRRHDKCDSSTKDACTAAKRFSRKRGNMPPKHVGGPDMTKLSRSKGEGRRGRMAHMSCTTTGKESSVRVRGLTSTEIFGGLMSGV